MDPVQRYRDHFNMVASEQATYAYDLPFEFLGAYNSEISEATELAGRVREIKKSDKGVYKVGRFLRACAWGALGVAGVITIVPALVYAVAAWKVKKDPIQWSHRLSLKPEQQLDLEDRWEKKRKEWKNAPLRSPQDLSKDRDQDSLAQQVSDDNLARLNRLFSASLEEAAAILLEETRPLLMDEVE